MPKMPDATSIARTLPQSQRGIVGYDGGAVGRAMQQTGGEIEATAANIQNRIQVGEARIANKAAREQEQLAAQQEREAEKQRGAQERLTVTQGQSLLNQGLINTIDSLKDNNDPETYLTTYDAQAAGFREAALAKITDPNTRAMVEEDLDNSIVSNRVRVHDYQRARQKDQYRGQITDDNGALMETALKAPDDVSAQESRDLAHNQIITGRDAGYFSAEEAAHKIKAWDEQYGINRMLSLPPQEQLKYLKPATAPVAGGVAAAPGFDTLVEGVLKREGGYNPTDSVTGMPVNFGIDQKAHPDIDVSKLTPEEAKGIYKTQYWDKYGIASLPASTQAVVFDGVVNHRGEFAQSLVAAAQAGATPGEIIALRRAEYQRLAEADPEKYGPSLKGWNNRLDGLEGGAGGGMDAGIAPSAPGWVLAIPFDKRFQLAGRAQAQELAQQAESEKQQAQKFIQTELMASRGEMTYEDLDALRPEMGERQFVKVSKMLDTYHKREDADVQARKGVADVLAGNGTLNPSDKAQVQAYDRYFQADVLPALEQAEPAQRNATIAGIIAKTGFIPPTVRGKMTSLLRTGTDGQVLEQAELYKTIKEYVPQSLSDFSKDDSALAMMVSKRIGYGASPKDAVLSAREAIDPANSAVREARLAELNDKKGKLKEEVDEAATDVLDTWRSDDDLDYSTEAGLNARADYRQAFEDNYTRTGDASLAKEYADDTIRGIYRKSTFNGGGVMKYAPENYYAIPDVDNDWMMEDFNQSLEAYKKETGDGLEVVDTMLLPDATTAREASSGAPTYKVMKKDRYGAWVSTGQRWRPDSKAKLQSLVDEARNGRDALAGVQSPYAIGKGL